MKYPDLNLHFEVRDSVNPMKVYLFQKIDAYVY